MLERFGAADRKFVVVCLAVAVVCGAVALRYFGRAFPEASIQFTVNRTESRDVARDWLSAQGLETAGLKHAATFDYDDETKTFLERKLGLDGAQTVYGTQVRLWRWQHRWFRPHQKEEFLVDVTSGGEVAAFAHLLAEDAPGATLEPDSARVLAESFLRSTMRLQLSDYEFVEATSTRLPNRVDHAFTWKKLGLELGDPDASYRVQVLVAGDRPAAYDEFLDIPQAWQDDYAHLRARNETAALVATVFLLLTWVAMLGTIVLRIRDRDVRWGIVMGFGSVACVLQLLSALNGFDMQKFGYETQDSYASFVTRFLLQAIFGALAFGGIIALLTAAAEPVYRERYPEKVALAGYFTRRGLRTKRFFKEVLLGLVLMLFFAAYQSIFYVFAAQRGAWAPLEVPYDNMLTTAIPWALVLFIGFFPAVSEEFTSRMFSVPFLDTLLGRARAPRWLALALAIVVSSFVWGFAHSNYPNQPFWIRGVEVGIAGIIVSFVMLRWGILAALVWHYTVDAFYTSLLMLRSGSSYFVASGAVTAGIMVVPLVAALVLYWRRGGFEPESGLRNLDFPRPRSAVESAVRVLAAPAHIVHEAIAGRRVAVGATVAAALLLLYFVPAEKPGHGIVLRSDREAAIAAGRATMASFAADPDSYRVAVHLASRYESSDGRYVLERASIARLNDIYTAHLRTPVWRVRFFRPDEREEYLFNFPVDQPASSREVAAPAANGGPAPAVPTLPIWAFEHVLPDSAPGDSLPTDTAQALAGEFLRAEGIDPATFELKESSSEKKKARVDHVFEWQVPDTTLGDAGIRYRVEVRGGEVAGQRPYLHLPEAWLRAYEESSVLDWISWGLSLGIMGTAVFLAVVLFVGAVRARRFPWGLGLRWGAVAAGLVLVLAALRWRSDLVPRYETEFPWQLFLVGIAISVFLLMVFIGLAVTVLVGTTLAVRPRVRVLFQGGCDPGYVRDGVLLGVLGIVLQVGVRRLGTVLTSLLSRHAEIGEFPVFEAAARTLPWLDVYLTEFLSVLVLLPALALLVHIVSGRLGLRRGIAVLAVAALVMAVDGVRSMPQFGLQFATGLAGLGLVVFLVAYLFRGNELAYIVAFAGARGLGAAAPWFEHSIAGARLTGMVIVLLVVATLTLIVVRATRPRRMPATEITA